MLPDEMEAEKNRKIIVAQAEEIEILKRNVRELQEQLNEAYKKLKDNPYARKEYGGPKGEEPTRYGTWESEGREIDF
jgi:hypothetical protein|tara:strand:- start:436 stop:666 length:231 start_codon:yes stop_codon:yes gene_type:complete